MTKQELLKKIQEAKKFCDKATIEIVAKAEKLLEKMDCKTREAITNKINNEWQDTANAVQFCWQCKNILGFAEQKARLTELEILMLVVAKIEEG